MIDNTNISKVLAIIKETIKSFEPAAVPEVADKDPYKILIATILSLRTKDEVTREASIRLFQRAQTPQEMIKLTEDEIAKLIYPVGFYRNKSKTILAISKILLEKYNGRVPDTIEELTQIKGIGRKTANLVVTLAYDKPGICVDTHVHRITNRWGYVKTKHPDETEQELRKKLPLKHWKEINNLLVLFGKNICKPVGPRCDICPINDICPKIGVKIKNHKKGQKNKK